MFGFGPPLQREVDPDYATHALPPLPTSVSNRQQTNRDRDHSLFKDNELLSPAFTPNPAYVIFVYAV